MRNYKSKRFGMHEIKKGKFKGAFHIATKDYKEFLGEISYLKDYLNRRILPAEPEEVLMTSILINLVNALDNEMVLIIKKHYKNKPSKNGDKLVERINEGFVSFKEKFTWMSKHKLIDNVQYHIMDDVRVLRNKHTHYRFSLRQPKFKYLDYPLMTKKIFKKHFYRLQLFARTSKKNFWQKSEMANYTSWVCRGIKLGKFKQYLHRK